jgi:hypothetical protein
VKGARLGLLILVWAALCAVGFRVAYSYAAKPEPLAEAAPRWPAQAPWPRSAEGFDLVLAVHPRCPCTRATLSELNKLLLAWNGKVKARALILKPFELSDLWTDTDITARLRQLPHTTVLRDAGGSTAGTFGLLASGQVLLYGPQGGLLFNGGLTSARGHEGASAGQIALRKLVSGAADIKGLGSAAVFGCSLKEKACLHGTPDEV